MARQNDTVAHPRANQNEMNDDDTDRENRQSSIFIDGDENEEQCMVTLEEFLQFVSEKPEWLYEKLRLIHQRYEECLDEHGVHCAEGELQGKAKDGEIALLRQELAEAKSECDAYSHQIVKMAMQLTNNGSQESMPATTSVRKTTKIPDPLMLTDGKEPQFEDWLLLMTQKLAANADHFDTSQLRMAYIASHCEGKARKHITPCM
ncbi:hypothetical protein SI65_09714 [Aspergillus cristatus]|uniref:Uncharacterized protein n=1 Tax=Aspergillus cristatus TaxID=573508 RepID=A0A1E3B202_ASPCR|nr:hypothetical protein SI65_09714 [Aspergillus cristatus]